MGIIGWIIFGFIVGLLARAITPGRDNMGLFATTILGVVGAFVAGWLGTALGWYTSDSGMGLIAATIGAIITLTIYNAITGRKRTLLKDSTKDRAKDRDRFAA